MNIYIKSFNRPFYLERCIASIIFNVRGYDSIIVLDDGTLSKYIEKIQVKYPNVIIKKSNADDAKFELLRQEQFEKIRQNYEEPAKYWVREIRKEKNNYFLLLEDDVWITKSINLSLIENNIIENNCVFLKFWWPIYENKLEVNKKYLFDDKKSIDYFKPNIISFEEISKIWIVAFAIFRKDYWLNSFTKVKRMGDEHTQLIAASDFLKHNPNCTFAKSCVRWIHQGWTIPGRATSEYYDMGLIQHLYMDILNEAWYNDEMDITQGYPFDFENQYIINIFKRYKLPTNHINIWESWKNNAIQYAY